MALLRPYHDCGGKGLPRLLLYLIQRLIRYGATRYGEPQGNCTLCPANSWCSKSKLNTCPPNAISEPGSSLISACVCPRGFVGEPGRPCVPCSADTWCASGILHDCPDNAASLALSGWPENCTCNAGYTGNASAACEACEPGSYKLVPGSAACELSPPDYYSFLTAAFDTRSVTACPEHQLSLSGSYVITQCICDLGYTGDDGAGCSACWPGTYKQGAGISVVVRCVVQRKAIALCSARY